jgi:hypothetical protein
MSVAAMMAIGSGLKAVSAFSGLRSSDKAASLEEQIAAENAARERAETEESIRRASDAYRKMESATGARIAGSSLGGKSKADYLGAMKKSNQEDLNWMKTSGESRASIIEREGKGRADTTRAQGRSNFFSGIGSAFTSGAMIFK